MYSIEFTKFAEKQLNKLPNIIQERVLNVLERIRINPFRNIKKKQGTSYFILRIGEYRAILNITNNISKIIVLDIGHRKNIYNK
jgi:mRNA interferase RelE/StbE